MANRTRTCPDCGKPILFTSTRCKTCSARHLKTRHGLARKGATDRMFFVWQAMKRRCYNQSDPSFSNYGGRGIQVHPEWIADAGAFCRHMGPRPSAGHTVERIDNEKGYEPGNVRWATRKEQARNTRQCKLNGSDIPFIRYWIARGYSLTSIGRAFGVSRRLITDIGTGKAWRD
jgi:hypothetical protein